MHAINFFNTVNTHTFYSHVVKKHAFHRDGSAETAPAASRSAETAPAASAEMALEECLPSKIYVPHNAMHACNR